MSKNLLAYKTLVLNPPDVRGTIIPLSPAQKLSSGRSPTELQSISRFNQAVYALREGVPLADASMYMYAPLTVATTPANTAKIATARERKRAMLSVRSW